MRHVSLILVLSWLFVLQAADAQVRAFDVRKQTVPDDDSYAVVVSTNSKRASISVPFLPEVLRSREPTLFSYFEQSGSSATPPGPFSIFSVSVDSVYGSFSNSSRFAPRGLLMTNGRLISERQDFAKFGRRDDIECPASGSAERPNETGIVCIAPSGNVRLLRLNDKELDQKLRSCRDAIQAGQFLVHQGKPAVQCRQTSIGRPRTAICLGRNDEISLLYTKNTSLRAMAAWMSRPVPEKGLGCDEALELSRDAFAGVVLADERRQVLKEGAISAPMPTAIMIRAR